MTIPQWKEYLQNLVRTDDKALLKAIVVIGQYQTAEELAMAETVDHNNRGFGAVDAEFMTGLYFRILRNEPLTRRELAIAHNKMPKYWRQLMEVAKAKGHQPREPCPYVVRKSDGQLAIKEVVM